MAAQRMSFIDRHGMAGVVALIVHPVVLAFTTPWFLVRALWSLRVLGREPWGGYLRMSATRSLVSSAHRAMDWVMERYGRYGYTYDQAMGRPVAVNFALTKLSLRIYRFAETLVPPLGCLAAVLGFLLFSGAGGQWWVVVCAVAVVLCSPLFYFLAFEAMKYDSLGWMLVPLGYWTLLNGQFLPFALVLLAVSFLSVSVLVVQGAVWGTLALALYGPLGVLAFIPAVAKLALHFRFLFQDGLRSLLVTLSGIGMVKGAKGRRKLSLTCTGIYLLAVWSVFCLALMLFGQDGPLLSHTLQVGLAVLVVGLYLVNKRLSRFADEQTMYALVVCAFLVVATQQLGWVMLGFLWLAVSTLPYLLYFADEAGRSSLLWVVPARSPWSQVGTRERLLRFMAPSREGDRLLFDLLGGEENALSFNGLKGVREYLHYLAMERGGSVVPDCYLIYEGIAGGFPLGKLCAAEGGSDLVERMRMVGARLALVVSDAPEPAPEFSDQGLRVESVLDIGQCVRDGVLPEGMGDGVRYLLLVGHPDCGGELVSPGELEAREPNRMSVRLDEAGRAVVKYTYAPGWRADGAEISRGEPLPWMELKGRPGAVVELTFEG